MKRLAILGNHLPRHCGIATFTTHLSDAIRTALAGTDVIVLAMNDAGRQHAYPPQVRFEIADGDLASYRRAADFLNVNQVDVLLVQHEYGIFGGAGGAHLLTLLRDVRMPVVTTLHTVLSQPNTAQRAVIDELANLSNRLVVMSASGAELLARVHGSHRSSAPVKPSSRATPPRCENGPSRASTNSTRHPDDPRGDGGEAGRLVGTIAHSQLDGAHRGTAAGVSHQPS